MVYNLFNKNQNASKNGNVTKSAKHNPNLYDMKN